MGTGREIVGKGSGSESDSDSFFEIKKIIFK